MRVAGWRQEAGGSRYICTTESLIGGFGERLDPGFWDASEAEAQGG